MEGIVSFGAYVPFHRLPRKVIGEAWGSAGGRGERSVANYDEDTITMAVAAGIDCLEGLDPKLVDALFLATTSAPYKERQNSNIIAAALDIGHEVRTADFGNSLRSGTIALLSALDAVKAGTLSHPLVTAGDMRMGAADGENEQNFGDGAAAIRLGREKVIAELEGDYCLSLDFPDKWRAQEDIFVRSWEDRWGLDEGYLTVPVEVLSDVLKRCRLTPKDISKACFPGPNSRKHRELGLRMGFRDDQIQDPLLDTVGDTGTALPLMILVSALEEAAAGDRLLLLSWGNGCDALIFRVTDEIKNLKKRRGIKFYLNHKKVLDNYGQYLRWRELITFEPPRRPERDPLSIASLWRESLSAMPLYGVKCLKCGTPQMLINFSSTRPHICLECGAKDEFEPYRFADKKGTVASFSHDYLGLSQDSPSTLTIVDFEGGGRGPFDMTDRDIAECQVGMAVEMTFRRLYYSRGISNYFWKCKPYRG
jgi:3-hydroxy-3-methylglutaryl CoA synthase